MEVVRLKPDTTTEPDGTTEPDATTKPDATTEPGGTTQMVRLAAFGRHDEDRATAGYGLLTLKPWARAARASRTS